MSKFTTVDPDLCIACGACGAVAPEIFDYKDDGIAYSIIDDNKGAEAVSEDLHEVLEEAAESCPTEAIKVQEEPFE